MSRRQMSHVERSHIMNHKPCCLLSRHRAEKDNKDNDDRNLCPVEKDNNSKRFRPRGLKYLQPWKLIIFWEPNNWGQEVISRFNSTKKQKLYFLDCIPEQYRFLWMTNLLLLWTQHYCCWRISPIWRYKKTTSSLLLSINAHHHLIVIQGAFF